MGIWGGSSAPWLVVSVQFHANRRNDLFFPCDEIGVICSDLGQSVHEKAMFFKGCEGFDQAAESA